MAKTTLKTVRKAAKGRAKVNQHSHASKIALIERRFQVMELRKRGNTVQQIATALKCDVRTVRGDIMEVMRVAIHETAETTEEMRTIQLERLDAMLLIYLPLATEEHIEEKMDAMSGTKVLVRVPPNPIYAQLVMSIEARRAKLLALDVPETKKIETTGIRLYEGVDISKV